MVEIVLPDESVRKNKAKEESGGEWWPNTWEWPRPWRVTPFDTESVPRKACSPAGPLPIEAFFLSWWRFPGTGAV